MKTEQEIIERLETYIPLMEDILSKLQHYNSLYISFNQELKGDEEHYREMYENSPKIKELVDKYMSVAAQIENIV